MRNSTIVRAILLATALTMFVVLVLANPLTRKTRVTFSQSVRVPGTVLNAGTYYFELPHPDKQTAVRVLDENGQMITQVMGGAFTRKRNHDLIMFGNHDCA